MPLDPSSLDSDAPRTTDGRTYPDHLRPYEQLDEELLPLLGDDAPHTFDDLSARVADARVRASLPRWLASATWRGLVARVADARLGPVAHVLTDRGRHRL